MTIALEHFSTALGAVCAAGIVSGVEANADVPVIDLGDFVFVGGRSYEITPHLDGMLEMRHDFAVSSPPTFEADWAVTDCETGETVAVSLLHPDRNRQGEQVFAADMQTLRHELFNQETAITTADIAQRMRDVGADVQETTDDHFAVRCAARGTGQLGGVLN